MIKSLVDNLGLPRILLALSPWETSCFAADAAFSVFPEKSIYRYSCPRQADPADWSRILDEIQPEILVVAWAAPSLPSGYLEAVDSPLRYVCFLTGSVRRLVPRSFIERGGMVTNWGGQAAPMVAEHALLLLLSALRQLPTWMVPKTKYEVGDDVEPMAIPTRTLHGATVSLHGFGQIARQFINLLKPFHVRVRAYSEGVPADFMRTHGAEPVHTLDELFNQADIIVEMEALTGRTKGSVTSTLIDRLADGAVFVNVGRGSVVNESALAKRAISGEISLALDVLEVEPLPTDSPLRGLPNVLISPHIAGPTQDQLPSLATRVASNLQLYLSGQPLDQLVTLEIYDRST